MTLQRHHACCRALQLTLPDNCGQDFEQVLCLQTWIGHRGDASARPFSMSTHAYQPVLLGAAMAMSAHLVTAEFRR